MHKRDKNEKKEERRARPPLQTRTGPTALSDIVLTEENKQHKEMAERAAKAQVLRPRREPRSLLVWGDRKKAVIKRYPDGTQEILVPQTLTPEQEHYEFPPRSRFLKKLATSTAEIRRVSVLQAPTSVPTPAPSTISTEMKQPDQLALQEYFSKKENRSVSNKDRAISEWIKDVERSSKTLLNKRLTPVKPSPTPSSISNKIQFKSDAGKRWASITSNSSLLPPDDTCRKHYVPRRLLKPQQKIQYVEEQQDQATEAAASKIQQIWKDYQNKSSPGMLENQVGIAAMATTGQRTPIAGMVHLVQMLHHSLKVQRQKSHDRMAKLEMLLEEETKKRQEAEEAMKQFYSQSQGKQKYQTLLSRVTELEFPTKRSKATTTTTTTTTTTASPPVRRRTLVLANSNGSTSKATASSTKDRTPSAGMTRKRSAAAATTPISTPRRRPTVPTRSKR